MWLPLFSIQIANRHYFYILIFEKVPISYFQACYNKNYSIESHKSLTKKKKLGLKDTNRVLPRKELFHAQSTVCINRLGYYLFGDQIISCHFPIFASEIHTPILVQVLAWSYLSSLKTNVACHEHQHSTVTIKHVLQITKKVTTCLVLQLGSDQSASSS